MSGKSINKLLIVLALIASISVNGAEAVDWSTKGWIWFIEACVFSLCAFICMIFIAYYLWKSLRYYGTATGGTEEEKAKLVESERNPNIVSGELPVWNKNAVWVFFALIILFGALALQNWLLWNNAQGIITRADGRTVVFSRWIFITIAGIMFMFILSIYWTMTKERMILFFFFIALAGTCITMATISTGNSVWIWLAFSLLATIASLVFFFRSAFLALPEYQPRWDKQSGCTKFSILFPVIFLWISLIAYYIFWFLGTAAIAETTITFEAIAISIVNYFLFVFLVLLFLIGIRQKTAILPTGAEQSQYDDGALKVVGSNATQQRGQTLMGLRLASQQQKNGKNQ